MPALKVFINNVEIGTLEKFEDESECFTFADSYCELLIHERPLLGQIFEDRFPNSINVDGPICWFTHLLPQGELMRKWLARLYDIDENSTFEFLTSLGSDMPGAVVLRSTEPLSSISAGPVSLNPEPKSKIKTGKIKFSLAGVQLKLSARLIDRGLTTNADVQGIEYIAKFHSPGFPGLPQCEFATMNWAKCAGINVPEFSLCNVDKFIDLPCELPLGDRVAFICKRFDRSDSGRIHVEDFGQILDRPPGSDQYVGSYEELARVIRNLAPESSEDFFRLMIFQIFSGNGDAHLKNFALIYPDSRNARLSPAYDLVSTICYQPKDELALSLFGHKKFHELRFQDLICLAIESGINDFRSEEIYRETIRVVKSSWANDAVRNEYEERHRLVIDSHISMLLENLS